MDACLAAVKALSIGMNAGRGHYSDAEYHRIQGMAQVLGRSPGQVTADFYAAGWLGA